MARRKSRIPRQSRAAALEQLRAFRDEDEQENTRNTRPEVSNQELLDELRSERYTAKRQNKAEKRQARNNAQALRQEEGPRAKIEYSGFSPGDLVMISTRANKRYGLERYNLYAGATGVIVEQEDQTLWQGDFEKGRWVQVMGPNGLQQWDVRWCAHLEDEEDED